MPTRKGTANQIGLILESECRVESSSARAVDSAFFFVEVLGGMETTRMKRGHQLAEKIPVRSWEHDENFCVMPVMYLLMDETYGNMPIFIRRRFFATILDYMFFFGTVELQPMPQW
jgi:hypothetical protein